MNKYTADDYEPLGAVFMQESEEKPIHGDLAWVLTQHDLLDAIARIDPEVTNPARDGRIFQSLWDISNPEQRLFLIRLWGNYRARNHDVIRATAARRKGGAATNKYRIPNLLTKYLEAAERLIADGADPDKRGFSVRVYEQIEVELPVEHSPKHVQEIILGYLRELGIVGPK